MVCSLSSVAFNTEDVYVPGTCWKTHSFGLVDTGEEVLHTSSIFYNSLGEITHYADKDCMPVYEYSDIKSKRTIEGYVYTENDKVFFAHTTEPVVWNLLYDFNLQEGDKCSIVNPWFTENTHSKLKTYMFKETLYPEKYNDLPVMSLYYVNSDGETNSYESAAWIKGIGSTWGLLCPDHDIEGCGFLVQKVYNGNRVFVEYQTSGIETAEIQKPSVFVTQGRISVRNVSETATVQITDINGMKIASDMHGECTFTVPSAGVYIVKAGDHVFKVQVSL
ncbi:MAG: hypothetical protein NC356_03930 [Ruminococcus sp.]|nr:hypothetical protein [Ruminococcus sp.]